MNYDLILFDLDGTLVDSSRDLTSALNYALDALGFPTYTRDEIISLVGHGVKETVLKGLPDDARQHLEEAYPLFLDYYSEHCADETSLYPGMREVLQGLSHKTLVVTTNKRSPLSEKILRKEGILDLFAGVFGPDRVQNKKPHPDHLRTALDLTGIPAENTVLVGDSLPDIQSARAAGVAVCAVTYGFTSRSVLEEAGPDYLIDKTKDLLRLFG